MMVLFTSSAGLVGGLNIDPLTKKEPLAVSEMEETLKKQDEKDSGDKKQQRKNKQTNQTNQTSPTIIRDTHNPKS